MKIIKIKFNKEFTSIKYENEKNEVILLKSPDLPVDEFTLSLQDLTSDICMISNLNKEIAKSLIVTGVTFKHSDPISYKVTFSCKRNVDLSNSTLNINTPLLFLGELNVDEEHYEFKSELKAKLRKVVVYATEFLNGNRIKGTEDEIPGLEE